MNLLPTQDQRAHYYMNLLPTQDCESLHSQAARHSRSLPSFQGFSHVVREQRPGVWKQGDIILSSILCATIYQ